MKRKRAARGTKVLHNGVSWMLRDVGAPVPRRHACAALFVKFSDGRLILLEWLGSGDVSRIAAQRGVPRAAHWREVFPSEGDFFCGVTSTKLVASQVGKHAQVDAPFAMRRNAYATPGADIDRTSDAWRAYLESSRCAVPR